MHPSVQTPQGSEMIYRLKESAGSITRHINTDQIAYINGQTSGTPGCTHVELHFTSGSLLKLTLDNPHWEAFLQALYGTQSGAAGPVPNAAPLTGEG